MATFHNGVQRAYLVEERQQIPEQFTSVFVDEIVILFRGRFELLLED